jgi:hypothetical protein
MTKRYSRDATAALPGPPVADEPPPTLSDAAMEELRLRHPRFLIWYGEATGRYWGMPLWSGADSDLIEARDPAEFSTLAAMLEAAFPEPTDAGRATPESRGQKTGPLEPVALARAPEPRPVPGAVTG